jgi:hypothetical protein
MDDITEKMSCELHIPAGNLTTRVAFVIVFLMDHKAVIHRNNIRPSYAKVVVDKVEKDYMELDLDIEGGDGETKLGQAAHGFILWRKCYIMIPWTPPRPPSLKGPNG